MHKIRSRLSRKKTLIFVVLHKRSEKNREIWRKAKIEKAEKINNKKIINKY